MIRDRRNPTALLRFLPLLVLLACSAERASIAEPDPAATPPARGGQSAAFDGERALDHARAIVDLGPRPAGSEALEATRAYVEETIRSHGLTVRRDPFVADTPEGPIEMANLIVDVPAAADAPEAPIIMISGHYDTFDIPGISFVGANDGGSSTAVLIELARVLAADPPPLPVRLVFFDGEEAIVRWEPGDNTYGSRHMVQRMREEGTLGEIGAMILLDMIGDADLAFEQEPNSTGWLIDLVWEAAEEAGHGEHFRGPGLPIEDDHLPFKRAGVAVIDLIDFDYGPGNRYWHGPGDTIDKLSADSFQVVGETVLAALPKLAEQLARPPAPARR